MNNCRLLHLILLLSFAPSSPGCQTSPSPPLNTTPQSGPINVVFWLDTGLLDEEREKAEDSIFTLAKKECTRLATGLEEAKVLPYVSVLTEHGYGKNIHVPGYDTPKKVCFRLDPQFLADRDRSVCDCERDIGQALLRSLGELEKMKEFRLRHSSAALRPDSPQRGVVVAWFGGNNISVSPAETKRSAEEFRNKWLAMEADHYQLKLLLVLPPYVKAEDLPEPLADFAAELKKAERFSLAHTCAFNGGGACTVDDEQNLSQALSTLGLEEPWQPMPRIPVPDDQQCCSCSPLDTSDIPNVPTVDVKAADTIAPPPDVMVEVVDAAQEISAEDMGDSDVQAERQDAVDASQELADATTQPAPPAVLNHFILLDRSKSVPQESLTDLLGRVTARIGCFVEPQDRIIFVPFATDYKPSAAGRGSEMMRAAHHVVDSLAREKTCLQAALAWCFGAQAEALMEEGDVPADVLAESPPCDSSDDDLVRRTLHEEFAKLRTDEGRVLWVYSDFKDDPAADLRRNLKAALRERRRDRPVVLVPLLATPTGCRDLERFVEPLRRELPVLGDSKRLLLP